MCLCMSGFRVRAVTSWRGVSLLRNSLWKFLLRALCVLVAGVCLAACQSEREPWVYRSLGMDAAVEVQIADALTERQKKELSLALSEEIERVEALISLQKKDSILNYWNSERSIVATDPQAKELLRIIERCFFFHEQTQGLFDITVQPLWQWYWQQSQLEEENQSTGIPEDILTRIGMEHIECSEQKLLFRHSETLVTLNGIGQGLVTDALYRVLEDYGIQSALIDAGEYRALGEAPWEVKLRSTHEDGSQHLWGSVSLSAGRALAVSSGNGYIFSQIKARPKHIMHPKGSHSSSSEAWPRTLAVLAEDATSADAMATALCLATATQREQIITQFDSVEVLVDPSE